MRGGAYWFSNGVNWRGMVAWIPAAVLGLLFANYPPLIEGPFRNVAGGVDLSLLVAIGVGRRASTSRCSSPCPGAALRLRPRGPALGPRGDGADAAGRRGPPTASTPPQIRAAAKTRGEHEPLARAAPSLSRPSLPRITDGGHVGQVDATVVPRFAGPADLRPAAPHRRGVRRGRRVVGVPFDAGVSYRPGRPLRPGARPRVLPAAASLQPGGRRRAVRPPAGGRRRGHRGEPVLDRGGHRPASRPVPATCSSAPTGCVDHRWRPHDRAAAAARRSAAEHGPVAVVHFDAHLDTWDTYFGAAVHPRHPVPPRVRGGPARHRRPACTSAPADRSTPPRTSSTTRSSASRSSPSVEIDDLGAPASSSGSASGSASGRSTSRSTSTCSTRRSRPGPGRPRPAA